ncbi:MAG: hypothetical protein RH860_10510 [Cytophagales bacterium]
MRVLVILILSIVLFSACSTDLDVNADFRETPIMFGLINQSDSINYIRLQKAYSNQDGNALEIAKNFDSLYYDTTKVKLTLLELDRQNGDTSEVDVLVPEYNEDKAPGDFAAPGQYVYKTDFNDFKPDGYEYIFKFENSESGLEATAVTDIIACERIVAPIRYTCRDFEFTGSLRRNLDFNEDGSMNPLSFLEFEGPDNAAFFSLEAVVEYTVEYEEDDRDRDTFSTKDNVWSVITLDLDENVPGKSYGSNGTIPIGETAFGSYLARVIDTENDEENGVISRALLNIQFTFYYYNESYENYLEVNGNFNPLSQTRPLYTNVDNGLGLIASRNILVTDKIPISVVSNFFNTNYFSSWPDLKFFFEE